MCLMTVFVVATLLCYVVHNILIGRKFQEPLKYQHLWLQKKNDMNNTESDISSIIVGVPHILTENEILATGLSYVGFPFKGQVRTGATIHLSFLVWNLLQSILFSRIVVKNTHLSSFNMSSWLQTGWNWMKLSISWQENGDIAKNTLLRRKSINQTFSRYVQPDHLLWKAPQRWGVHH